MALLARDRQEEALRMGLGLTILDDDVDIFVLDRKLDEAGNAKMSLEMINELGIRIYTNFKENTGMEFLAVNELAAKLLSYDHVLPY